MSEDLFSTPEHQLFRESVRKFVEEELRPRAREFDEMGRIDKSLCKLQLLISVSRIGSFPFYSHGICWVFFYAPPHHFPFLLNFKRCE